MGNGLVQTQCVIYVAEVAPIAIRYAYSFQSCNDSDLTPVRGVLLASYALLFQLGGLAGAVGLQILQTVSAKDVCSRLSSCIDSISSLLKRRITCESCSVNGFSPASSSSVGSFYRRRLVSKFKSESNTCADYKGTIAERTTLRVRSEPYTSSTERVSMPRESVSDRTRNVVLSKS